MSRRRILSIAILAVILLVAAAGAFLFRARRQTARPEPNIDNLRQVLEKSAGEQLGAPLLSNSTIAIDVPQAKIDSELARIDSLARALGGAAIRSTDDQGNTKLLIQLPPGHAAQFTAQVTGRNTPREEEKQSDSTELIDILLRPKLSGTAASSP